MKFSKFWFILCLPVIFGYTERKRKKQVLMELADSIPIINEFSTYATINPEIMHKQQRRFTRSISDVVPDQDFYTMSLNFELNGQQIFIDLKQNDDFLPTEHFVHLQDASQTAGYKSRNFTKTEMKPCHYQGSIRYKPKSKVILSTCADSFNGIIYDDDDDEVYFIHKGDARNLEDKHILFRQRDLLRSNETFDHQFKKDGEKSQSKRRLKRFLNSDREHFREPYKANDETSYLEFVIVVDNAMFNFHEKNVQNIHHLCLDLTQIINVIYAPLNIFVVLTDVVIWSERDEITISNDASRTLKSFLEYRKTKLLKSHPNDHAHLLTSRLFDDNIVGKAQVGVICGTDSSAAVCVDHSRVVGLVASTMAHEMGHNFGLDHDEKVPGCVCPQRKCVMSQLITSTVALQWSSCSLQGFRTALNRKMNYCMHNKPRRVLKVPFCGNRIVDPGEECDCGLPHECDNVCCNPKTCKLSGKAACATGRCCDLETCSFKSAGTMCRAARSECDLPEFCNGVTESCPMDTFKQDLEPCDESMAYCYQGQCDSHRQGCQFLWGKNATSDFLDCYTHNARNNREGSCGFNHITNAYTPCEKGHELCGMLQCQTSLRKPIVGSSPLIGNGAKSFERAGRKVVGCTAVTMDFGVGNDPGFVANGAKCGDNKMCLNQKCIDLEDLRLNGHLKSCASDCSGNGVCNNRGHCHCDIGFGGEKCNLMGPGGSVDSGPATSPKPETTFRRFVLIFGVLALFFIMGVLSIWLINCYYSLQTNKNTNYKQSTNVEQNVEEQSLYPDLSNFEQYSKNLQAKNIHDISKSKEYLLKTSKQSLENAKNKSDYSIKVIDLKNKNSPTTTLKTAPRTLNISQNSLKNFNADFNKFNFNSKSGNNNEQNIEIVQNASSDHINIHSNRKHNLLITNPQLKSTTNSSISNEKANYIESCENLN